MFSAWHLVSTYQVVVFVLKTSQGPSPASALEIYAWKCIVCFPAGFCHIHPLGELPVFPLIFTTPTTSPGMSTHMGAHTHTHTHTCRCRLSQCPVLHHLLSPLQLWSPSTSASCTEFTWPGFGDPSLPSSFSAFSSGPALLRLDL